MKKVLSLAALCAMAAAPALAAGGMQQQRSQMMDQPSGWQQQQQSQAPGQALDESMVREIQQQLQSQGYNVQPDGIFGPNTRQALRQFQQDQGIQASGRVDTNTLAALGVIEGGTQQAQTPEEQQRQQQQRQQQRQPEFEDQQEFQERQGGTSR